MNRNLVSRLTIAAVLLFSAATFTNAFPPPLNPVLATPVSFSSSPAQSVVNVVIHNPNSELLRGTLTILVVYSGGIRQQVSKQVYFPAGNSTHKVFVNHAISSVYWTKVTNVAIVC